MLQSILQIIIVYSDCFGYMLPKTFITKEAEIYNYYCCNCAKTKTSNDIDMILENIGRKLNLMKKNDVDACMNFLRKYTLLLHENHYYLTDVKIALAQLIGQSPGGLPLISNELLSRKILICKQVDKLVSIITPGIV